MKIFLSLGSNMGDRVFNLHKAFKLIDNHTQILIASKSKIYETSPMENQNQDYFLNQIIKLQTKLDPLDLLDTVRKLKKRIPNSPKAGVYFSCLARGPNMFKGMSRELKLIESELGDLPIIGLFCNGEISNQRLYSYTGVLTLFI